MDYVKEIYVGTKKKLNAEEKKKASELVERERKEDSKLVMGVFKNIECQGGDLEFSIKLYRGDPIRTYRFLDGETYEIPLGVAKHINRQCKYIKHKWLLDKDGKKTQGYDKPVERYQFVSQDYM